MFLRCGALVRQCQGQGQRPHAAQIHHRNQRRLAHWAEGGRSRRRHAHRAKGAHAFKQQVQEILFFPLCHREHHGAHQDNHQADYQNHQGAAHQVRRQPAFHHVDLVLAAYHAKHQQNQQAYGGGLNAAAGGCRRRANEHQDHGHQLGRFPHACQVHRIEPGGAHGYGLEESIHHFSAYAHAFRPQGGRIVPFQRQVKQCAHHQQQQRHAQHQARVKG